jgi:hypothetical protein
MHPSDHEEAKKLLCSILKYYGFNCTTEYKLKNNQRIDIVAGLDYEEEVAIEVEFNDPDYMNDIEKLTSFNPPNIKLKIIVSNKFIQSNISGIKAVLIPSENNKDFENLLKSMFRNLDPQCYPYHTNLIHFISPSFSKILENPRIDQGNLKDIIYRKSITKGEPLPKNLADTRENRIDEVLDMQEDFYLYSYMERFGEISCKVGHLGTPFGIYTPDYMGNTCDKYETMTRNRETIKSIIRERLNSKANEIQQFMNGISNNLLQILLYGSNGEISVPGFVPSYTFVKYPVLNDHYLELIYYGGMHPSANQGFNPNYLRLIPLLSIPVHKKLKDYYDQIKNFLNNLVSIGIAFNDGNIYKFPSLDIGEMFGIDLNLNLNSSQVLKYISWWAILNYKEEGTNYNSFWADSDLEVISRNLNINNNLIIQNLQELEEQALITPLISKNGIMPSYRIYNDNDFFSYIIDTLANVYSNII